MKKKKPRKKKAKGRPIVCRSGRVYASRAAYRTIYKAVRARREAYWRQVETESTWISLPQEPGLTQ